MLNAQPSSIYAPNKPRPVSNCDTVQPVETATVFKGHLSEYDVVMHFVSGPLRYLKCLPDVFS
jgi:hypothetical protein